VCVLCAHQQILNAIQKNALLGQGSNQMSVPTDCDQVHRLFALFFYSSLLLSPPSNLIAASLTVQRDERLGWMGDADLSADSFAINYDYSAFQDAFIRAMLDAQVPYRGLWTLTYVDITLRVILLHISSNSILLRSHSRQPSDGSLPDVVPFARYGSRPADVSWSAALPQNVYVRYKVILPISLLSPMSQLLHWYCLLCNIARLMATCTPRHSTGARYSCTSTTLTRSSSTPAATSPSGRPRTATGFRPGPRCVSLWGGEGGGGEEEEEAAKGVG
jgi:hypothetical protein